MYKKQKLTVTTICRNENIEGETIEMKMERVINNGEPISEGAPLTFTDRADGVLPEYNIRTDRFEIAVEAMDKSAKSQLAKRQELLEEKKKKENPEKEDHSTENEKGSEKSGDPSQ